MARNKACACASVLATMKSTPSISARIMLAMALPPEQLPPVEVVAVVEPFRDMTTDWMVEPPGFQRMVTEPGLLPPVQSHVHQSVCA